MVLHGYMGGVVSYCLEWIQGGIVALQTCILCTAEWFRIYL